MLESWTGAAGAIKLIGTEGTILPVLHGGLNRCKTLHENFCLPCLKALISWDSSSSGEHLLIPFVMKINRDVNSGSRNLDKGHCLSKN